MATYKINESYPPFEYGSAVTWPTMHSLQCHGSICGFRVLEGEGKFLGFDAPAGTVLALIEEKSGETVEIPLHLLKLV